LPDLSTPAEARSTFKRVAVLGNGGMAVDSAANLYVIDNGKWGGETAGGLTPPLQRDAVLCCIE
jgi:hypothetical protein